MRESEERGKKDHPVTQNIFHLKGTNKFLYVIFMEPTSICVCSVNVTMKDRDYQVTEKVSFQTVNQVFQIVVLLKWTISKC
jgi:hypothetical protein